MNKKEVIFYYDSTATKSNYAVNDADFATTIIAKYRKKGWNVVPMYIGNPEYHNIKHKEINLGLRGQKGLVPYFNKDHNEALILATNLTKEPFPNADLIAIYLSTLKAITVKRRVWITGTIIPPL